MTTIFAVQREYAECLKDRMLLLLVLMAANVSVIDNKR